MTQSCIWKVTMRIFYFSLIVIHFISQTEGAFFEQSAIKTARVVAKVSTFHRSINQPEECLRIFSKRVFTTTEGVSSSVSAFQMLFNGGYQSDKRRYHFGWYLLTGISTAALFGDKAYAEEEFQSSPSHATCAKLALESYTKGGGQCLPDGWKFVSGYYPERRWGLGIAAYINPETRDLVVSYRGTTDIWNVITDIGLWRGQLPPHQDHAEAWATEKLNDPDARSLIAVNSLIRHFGHKYIDSTNILEFLLRHIVLYVQVAAGNGLKDFLIAAGISDSTVEAVDHFFMKKLRDELHELDKSTVDIVSETGKAFQESKIRSVTVVGHSLGGFMAQLTACRLRSKSDVSIPVSAVVFESPGIYEIVKDTQEYKQDNYNFITNYLSAPNIINTCYTHPGNVRRVFIDHTPNGWEWGHFASCLGHSALRIATPIAIVSFPVSSALLSLAAGGAGVATVQLLASDKSWLERQHSIDNIIKCFNTGGLPNVYAEIHSWPTGSDIFKEYLSFKKVLPLQKDSPGLRVMFHENWMRENQVLGISQYKVKAYVGKKPDWVDVG